MWLRLLIILSLLWGSLATPVAWSIALADGSDDGGKGSGDGGKDDKGKGDKSKGDKSKSPNHDGSKDNPGANSTPSDVRSYYGQVTLNSSGQVLVGDTWVQSSSPWLRLAAPGMWLEASGTWNGQTFVATEVKLQVPQEWAYFQGPADLIGAKDYQYASAWLGRGPNSFLSLKASPDGQNQVRVVAYYDGSKLRAVPTSFPAPPAGLKPGWVELIGMVGSQGLVWISAKPFP
ncbi:MAG: hypothetical protein IVW51_13755 [Thermaceae bacterium]|nr:hypothetical protein [Thermaceae bacterium]